MAVGHSVAAIANGRLPGGDRVRLGVLDLQGACYGDHSQ